MGCWGTGIFSNDTAADVKADYIDLLRKYDSDFDVNEMIVGNYQDILKTDEEPLFWFALASTQWDYGRLSETVAEKALGFLAMKHELDVSGAFDGTKYEKWIKSLSELENKIKSPQPPIKKITKSRLYQCKWKKGDVFAYKFNGEYSRSKGYCGKYVVFKKISESEWYPGHIVPVISVYNWIGNEIPSLDVIENYSFLVLDITPEIVEKYPNKEKGYEVLMTNISERVIPTDFLTPIGNVSSEIDNESLQKYYSPLSWETQKSNWKFEETIIRQYVAWNNIEDGSKPSKK